MSHFITYVALDEPGRLSAAELAAACRSIVGAGAITVEPLPVRARAGDDEIAVAVNGVAVVVLFIDRPLPEETWSEPARLAIAWREAGAVIAAAKAHAIVVLPEESRGHPAVLGGATASTVVAAGLALRLAVAATVFEDSAAVFSAERTVEAGKQLAAGQIPVTFWTTLIFLRGPATAEGAATAGALTLGLRPFIGREFEFLPCPLHPVEIAERLLGLARYLMVEGAVIGHGETVGLTERERIRVAHAEEGQRPGIPVLLLDLEVSDPEAPVPPELGGATERGARWSPHGGAP